MLQTSQHFSRGLNTCWCPVHQWWWPAVAGWNLWQMYGGTWCPADNSTSSPHLHPLTQIKLIQFQCKALKLALHTHMHPSLFSPSKLLCVQLFRKKPNLQRNEKNELMVSACKSGAQTQLITFCCLKLPFLLTLERFNKILVNLLL